MPRPKTSEGRETRKLILDAALELFAEHGFHGASLRDIARAVGVRESAIYHWFESKDVLFETLLGEAVAFNPPDESEILDMRELKVLDLRAHFEKQVVSMFERASTLRERKIFRIVMSDGLRPRGSPTSAHLDRLGVSRVQLWTLLRVLQHLGRLREGDIDAFVLAFVGPIVHWRLTLLATPAERHVAEYRPYARQVVEHFLRGIVSDAERERTFGKQNARSTHRS